ncbi:amino acid adenylation domain-containing protein [Rhodococcus chondri]|uniref:Amino acid adenylation domain-containing protein n=1 Tax=Rhodococcus chondri TaxID=3065941 RepID=A0ABU7JYF5_9NOCA|nr:amino acid adenylation domain-containing protein [Rhodococcus sp. CC-R104]MEE2034837.1 amino acid adenylation domain-containing protein [Rhodococcus sp. CC-R104]
MINPCPHARSTGPDSTSNKTKTPAHGVANQQLRRPDPILNAAEHAAVSRAATSAAGVEQTLLDALDEYLGVHGADYGADGRDLADRSRRLAGNLVERGLGAEDRVAVILPMSGERAAALWAVVRSGAAPVPIAPDLPEQSRALLCADAGVVAAIAADPNLVPVGVTWIDVAAARGAGPVPDPENLRPTRLDHVACVSHVSTPFGSPASLGITQLGMSNLIRNRQRSGRADREGGGRRIPSDPALFDDLFGFLDPSEAEAWSSAPDGPVSAILLDTRLRLVPLDSVGELYLAAPAPGWTRGFEGRPGWTAVTFVANPLGAPGSRMYRQGVSAYWDDEHRPRPVERPDPAVEALTERRRALDGIETPAPLQIERNPAAGASRTVGTATTHLPEAGHRALLVLAQQERASMFVLVHASLAALVSRLCPDNDVIVGTSVGSGADRNVVPLRTVVDARQQFRELVRAAKDFDFQAVRASDVPFDALADLLGGRRPQVGLASGSDEDRADAADFDLLVAFRERSTGAEPSGIDIEIRFVRELFDESVAVSMARQLRGILESVAAAPATEVRDIPLESGGLLEGEVPDAPTTLAEMLSATAARHPELPAVADTRATLTYRELDEQSNRLAHELVAAGVARGHVVALMLRRSVELVVAVWAVAKTGAAYLPLDPNQPPHRIDEEMRGAAVVVGICEKPPAADVGAGVHWLPMDSLTGSAAPVRVPVSVDEAAYVIYTSGSTGVPKGVVVTHRGLGPLASWAVDTYRVTPNSRVLQGYNPAFDAAQLEMLLAFASGACLVVAPHDVFAGDELQQFLIDQRVTHFLSTPAVLASLDPERSDGLQVVAVGGEALPPELAALWSSHSEVPDRLMINAYGPTESTVVATATVVGEHVTIGSPFPGVTALVLDDRLRHVPPGGSGELYLASGGLARGYLGAPALTAERFVANPVAAGRMYRTGDLVHRRPDGRLDFIARIDQQVKLRGLRIELGEIDAAVREVSDVDSVVTTVRRSDTGTEVLVSYLVSRTALDTDVVRRQLGEILPAYMVPTFLVVLDTLPLTPSGKLDRRSLPIPESVSPREYRPPVTHVERVVAGVFAELLGQERIGLDDDFFVSGGHSLLAIRAVAQIQSALGRTVPVQWLLTETTTAALAHRLEHDLATVGDPFSTLLPLHAGGSGAPLFCIHPIAGLAWPYSGLSKYVDTPLYGVQSPGVVDDRFCPGSLDELAHRYITEIRRVYPSGPYRLLGWSLGGVIAHAMAVQLQAAGETVEILAMLDSFAGPVAAQADIRQVSMGELLGGLGLDSAASAAHDTWDPASIVAELATTTGLPRERVAGAVERLTVDAERNVRLMEEYRPNRFHGDIVYFTATSGHSSAGAGAVGWNGAVTGSVIDHPVPVVHWDMTAPEAFEVIGPVLRERLAR